MKRCPNHPDRKYYAKGWCHSCYQRETGNQRRSDLKRKYGITQAEVDELLEQQNNRCRICLDQFSETEHTKRIVVDHDHTSGQVRGLLCRSCNVGLGNFMDNEAYLLRAIEYLRT